jgi:hypothetical protein
MQDVETDDFETLWERSHRLPAHIEVSVPKIKPDLDISRLLDRYLEFSREAVIKHELTQEAFERLVERTDKIKDALSKIDHNVIDRIGRELLHHRLNR